MTRRFTATLMVLGLAGLLAFDLTTTPPNPYKAPVVFAFGSGLAASGGFCGALPN
ncbi:MULTISPECIES: hypothetical protein [Gemmobacter]|jgi:hypothetical protein|uniref:Uncharacterized protein n=2 Tax=Gemmobacter TaxID=204456 RepID=A0A2T6ABM3_9RHOB|nr:MULTISPECIES: hypothetical protein [Gemmobacter]PTX41226.1 hypothetical protein C8N34_13110 [Gemmobacter caeni]TWI89944.1 hypothetical protein IQ03_05024 [Gemmobacter caeni]GHC38757.1 hypothetical protein GCM10007291_45530 [Gemmobacter nanjingensis]